MKTLSRFLVSLLAIFAFTCFSYNYVHSQCMVWDWASNSETQIYHNSGWDIAKDIATDVNNNIIVVGDF
ncbi:MAG: hypothetical protein PHW83_13355, partial [Bacteroidales bacterium]|nr:hypothetical protein [Bacteroidales bacterium]